MARKSHRELVEWEKKYPTDRRGGYSAFREDMTILRDEYYKEFLQSKQARAPSVDEVIAAYDIVPSEEFAQAYELEPETLEGRLKGIQKKYILRFKNIRRSWSMLLQYMPELMSQDRSLKVLEMSTAHGATLEILKELGHDVVGNDYANFLGRGEADTRFRNVNELDLAHAKDDHGLNDGKDGEIRDWPYKPIIDSIGVKVDLFDAGITPYPYDEDRFDAIICMDALEHYCHPRDWVNIVDEFTRISKESVFLLTNPVQGQLIDDKIYMEAFYRFQKKMMGYSHNGFRCVTSGIHRNQLTAYKLVKIG